MVRRRPVRNETLFDMPDFSYVPAARPIDEDDFPVSTTATAIVEPPAKRMSVWRAVKFLFVWLRSFCP